jgi:hypothetical protein
VAHEEQVQDTQGDVQDTVRDDLDRRRSRLAVFPSRIYDPPVRLKVQVSTDTVIDEPVVGFGNDISVSDTPVTIPPR